MTLPFMLGSLIILPKAISYIVLIVLLIAGIVEFRQGHIGRIGIFLNSILLWQIFYPTFNTLPSWFQWYLNIGTVIGVIALLAYFSRQSLPTIFYQVCFMGYGSISILIVSVLFIFGVHSVQPAQISSNISSNLTNGSFQYSN
ncbi:MAG: hypothetical protein Q8O89_05580 [Nanoarchaeota archaeon]|nr:hypothetical protein [Nanoarchaeota archaeon]